MRRLLICLMFALSFTAIFSVADAQEDPNLVAPTDPLSPQEQVKHFHLPPGFEMQLIAAEPDIGQPTNIQFDSRGRLWINSTLEYPYPANGPGRDRLSCMDDTNGDGVPDRIHTFADGLNIPIGVASIHGSVIAYSIPSIDRFIDKDDDGKSEHRETLFKGFGFRDTHGMASSFRPWIDGWIYACHGFSNDSNIEGKDQSPVTMNSGNTYRFRPDGSRLEQWTWGQVNPYGLAFDSWGNLFSADCHTKPAFMLLRGAYYDSFGKPHDGLGYGPEMIDHFHGSTGIAGIVAYDATHFPADFQGNLFIGNPVTGRVNRDRLDWHGSSPKAVELPDLISCDDRWFRPVDITLAPDGSLYIADFYNCIIGHYEVRLNHPRRDRQRGRIWRLVYTGDDKTAQPTKPMADLSQAEVKTLVERLGDSNITVRVLATNELVDRVGQASVVQVRQAMIDSDASAQLRAHALWVIERLVGLSAGEVQSLANDPRPLVRTHLVRALGTRKSIGDARAIVITRLTQDQHPTVVRAAAEVLGWQVDAANVSPLLDAWRACTPADTHRIHQIRIALRNNLRELGDMPNRAKDLQGSDLDERLLDVALGISNKDSAAFVFDLLQSFKQRHPRERELYHYVCRFSAKDQLGKIYQVARETSAGDIDRQMEVMRGIYQGAQVRGESLPDQELTWVTDVARSLIGSADTGSCRKGLDFVRELRLSSLAPLLEELASPKSIHPSCQQAALETLAVVDHPRAVTRLSEILQSEAPSRELKHAVADMLGKLRSPDGTTVLSKLISTAPADYAVSLARGLSRSDHGGDALLRLIEEGRAAPELLNDGVVAAEINARVFDSKDERLATIRQRIPSPDEALQKFVDQRRSGFASAVTDVEKGRIVFEKNCANCHQIGGQGAKIGPQLDGIGIRGFDRLLEDTLDPNRNVDQAFRRTNVLMSDGSLTSGMILRQEGAVLVMADSNGKEVRIPESEIDERQESTLSPMPNDVAKILSPEDFYNLMVYLLSQQTQAPAAR